MRTGRGGAGTVLAPEHPPRHTAPPRDKILNLWLEIVRLYYAIRMGFPYNEVVPCFRALPRLIIVHETEVRTE